MRTGSGKVNLTMGRTLYRISKDFSSQMKKQNISAFASSTAFFLFLSLVPMLVMICTIIPFTPLTEENLVAAIEDFVPAVMDPLVQGMVAEVYDKSAGILSIAAIATLWSAAQGVLALMRGLNAINGVEEKRNYVVVRLIASFYTLVMLIVLILSLFVMVFGNELVMLILHKLPRLRLLVSFIMKFRFLFGWCLLALVFTVIYTFVPDKKLQFREQIPGAVLSSAIWIGFSWGFSLYVGSSGSYSIYGSLSVIVIVMLWLYFGMYIMMLGAYVNRYFQPVNKALVKRRKQERG
ncbi:MAG: YihY/virulence factor BrkB family protein [Bacteroidales bacterium]|nr:YihY/virulence factor BrkB family protein [Lachnoclostridium sp.]MCM1382994.1 YihY/virulence factor BrkB family protein [Lachnoclostridium sp.]MCM1463952.1 YihY/virulence factor BrkB family protein [Bacteroidales bacterium]